VGTHDLIVPLVVTVFVLVTMLFPQSPLRDAVTYGDVQGMRLGIGTAYTIFSPFCAMLDMQALLTVPQHIAFMVTLIVGFLAWRGTAFARSTSYPSWGREAVGLLLAVLLIPFVVLLINVLPPRPMAKLVLDDPELVAVDVHSHTSSSHDGRPDWTPARVRSWHARSGFNVAYITDHKRFGGAVDGLATNPAHAGDGVVLLGGLELFSGGQHVNVLSMTQAESTYIVEVDHLTKAIRLQDGRVPLILQTIPFDFTRFAGRGQDTLPVTRAIELNDGAPKGLTVGLTRHAQILRYADSLDLALVAGSDNHGWGNTASGWTLVRVPGWRALTPAELAVQLETTMLRGRHGTQVVERRTPLLVSVPEVALTVPVMFLTVARSLTLLERLSWISWAWALLLVRIGVRQLATASIARARAARRARRLRMRIVPIARSAVLSR
jgi:predicted metal-dependent phosphoesterase TrpH